MSEQTNARIESTYLGIGEPTRGNFGAWLDLVYPNGHGQGAYVRGDQIPDLLKAVGVQDWRALVGLVVRVEAEPERVVRIGNAMKNTWLELA